MILEIIDKVIEQAEINDQVIQNIQVGNGVSDMLIYEIAKKHSLNQSTIGIAAYKGYLITKHKDDGVLSFQFKV